jgi:hypothetical protein
MKISGLHNLFNLRRYVRLRKDFRNPLTALIAASGSARRTFTLITHDGDTLHVNRDDLPLWEEYFNSRHCNVSVRDSRFYIEPHNSRHPPYFIAGAHQCLTSEPGRWHEEVLAIPLVRELQRAEHRVFSQHGEDGVLEQLLNHLPEDKLNHFIVEFGAYDGICMSNSRNLLVNHGWHGLLIEADPRFYAKLAQRYQDDSHVTTLKQIMTPENINSTFAKHGVPRDLDILSIDIDSIDYYVWQGLTDFRPKIVVIEYNACVPSNVAYVAPRDEAARLSGTSKEGASFLSLLNLGHEKGYRLVYSELSGANLFFVHEDYAQQLGDYGFNPLLLYQPPQFGQIAGGGAPNGRGYT